MSKELVAYTDGGSDNNPGVAAWAFYIEDVIKCNGYGGTASNNEMELTAMINCLEYIGRDREATIFCDSTYVIKGITEWIEGWIKKDWITSSGTKVANKHLWERLKAAYNKDKHKLLYVKGHSGIYGNELCDQLVQEAKQSRLPRTEVLLTKSEAAVSDVMDAFYTLVSRYEKLSPYDKREIPRRLSSELIKFNYKINHYE